MGVMSQCCLGICGITSHGISETTLHTFFDVVRTLILVLNISDSTFAIPYRPLSLPQLQTSFGSYSSTFSAQYFDRQRYTSWCLFVAAAVKMRRYRVESAVSLRLVTFRCFYPAVSRQRLVVDHITVGIYRSILVTGASGKWRKLYVDLG